MKLALVCAACALAAAPMPAAIVNIFTDVSGGGNGGSLMTFSDPVGNFYASDLTFAGVGGIGGVWSPLGLTQNYGADIFDSIQVASAGTYTFQTSSDDGSLLFVDGQLVVNNNLFQGVTTLSGQITLSAGIHQLEVQYFQGGGAAYLSAPLPDGVTLVDPSAEELLDIYAASSTPTASYPVVGSGDTLYGVIPTALVNYGTLYNGSLGWFPFGLNQNFVAEMQGFLQVPSDGSYTFSTTSDDGSWLYIDGQQVVDNGFFQGFTQRSGTVDLTAGQHSFDLQYFQGGGGAGLDMGIPSGVSFTSGTPEPSGAGLAAAGLALVWLVRRKRSSHREAIASER